MGEADTGVDDEDVDAVAGVAALYLGLNPGATPQQVRDKMVNNATANKVGNPGAGSPNKLLFSKVNKWI